MNNAPIPGINRKIRVALLSFAHTHAETYAKLLSERRDVEVIAADPEGSEANDKGPRGAELAARLGLRYVHSYEEALAWYPDVVIVTAENSRHRELVEAAAMAGAHILCEKPLATTPEDARAMVRAAQEANVFLMAAYPVRFSPAFLSLRDRIRAGKLGRILAIRGTNNGKIPLDDRAWFTDPKLSGGGALVDHVVHCADLIDELLGDRAVQVRAVTNRILHEDAGVGVETGGLVTVIYPDGVIASIDCSWSCPASSPTWGGLTLQVVGTLGTATIDPFSGHVSGHDRSGAVWAPIGDDPNAAMLDELLSAAREARIPQPDGGVGLRTLEIVSAAQESALTGQPVKLASHERPGQPIAH
ncbi:Gfo/Idh/MocA family oxidoreductase [Micrococcaceae bacterium Sec5.7]